MEGQVRKHIKRSLWVCCILLFGWMLYSLVSHRLWQSDQKYEKNIKVLTLNTHGMLIHESITAKQKMLQYLNQQDADIICLQEVLVYKNPKRLTLPALREAMKKYPYT